MTGMLASVTRVAEAAVVLEAGAGIIDLKNPSQGALGALPEETIREVVRFVNGRKPVSATVGDLPMVSTMVTEAVERTAATGVDFVKVGLFGQSGHETCIRGLRSQTRQGIRVVAVLFADQAPDFSILQTLADAGFYGAMIDTANKADGGLRKWFDVTALQSFVRTARTLGLFTGLAGALRMSDIAPLLSVGPDYLGFRGALCGNDCRESELDPTRVAAISRAVAQMQHIEHEDDRETLHCNTLRAYSSG
jgi:uncharacterized protein (UPF0264 family)